MQGVTLITPTGDRHEAFALCERWISRQTWRGPLQWIVVDDGAGPPTPCTRGQTFVRRRERPDIGPSLNRNLLVALGRVQHPNVLIIEDDDWYAPRYIERMVEKLGKHALVGEGLAKYYHVGTRRYLSCRNRRHASLCQTGFRRDLLPLLDRACRSGNHFIDVRFWKLHGRGHVFFGEGLSVGIKGLPGRCGLGIGHRPGPSFRHDPDGTVLKRWVGDDALVYRRYGDIAARDGRDDPQPAPGGQLSARDAIATSSPLPAPVTWWEAVASQEDRGASWLILGKGPSFDVRAARVFPGKLLGLNHVVRELAVDVAHVIDAEVLFQVPDECWRTNCKRLVMPWHPHVGHRAFSKTLPQYIAELPVLREKAEAGRLLAYHAGTGERFGTRPPSERVVPVRYFSSEAALGLLALAGIKTVRTSGIDGGSGYAADFEDLAPLTNGRRTFDDQFPQLRRIATDHRVDLRPWDATREA